MGLFDSIIGTAKADSEDPTPFVLVADEREEFVPFDATSGGGGSGSGSGTGDGSGSGSGTDDGTGGTGTGNGSGWGFDGDRKEANPLAFAHVEEPIITEKVEEPAEVNIDIGGDLTDLIPEIPESVVITSETPTAPSDILITDEVSPLSESDEGSIEPIIDTASTDITPIDVTGPDILDASDIPDTLFSGDTPLVATTLESLDEKITGFVAELEELKADDEMLLHEKEAAIEKLEGEMKDLEKEVKKIQADEKKIDSTIASLNGTTKTK